MTQRVPSRKPASLLSIVVPALLNLMTACGERGDFVPPEVPASDYRRIVSLTPSVTEILFALGAGDRVAGVTSWCDHPPEAVHRPRVGDFLRPNLEAVLSLDPDLVILAPTGDLLRESYDNLVELGLTVLVVWNNTLAETFAAIETVGRILRIDDRARELVASLRAGLAAEQARLAGAAPVRVLWLVGRRPLVAVGEETFQHELLAAAGGSNVAAGLGPWPVLSSEFLLECDPDVILDSAMGAERGAAAAGAQDGGAGPWEEFPGLSAVKNGRVHVLDQDAFYRPGPRMVEALALLGRTLHPGLGH